MGCDMVLSYVCVYGMNLLSNLGRNYKEVRVYDVVIYTHCQTRGYHPQDISKSTLSLSLYYSEYTLYYTIYTMSQAPIGILYRIKQRGQTTNMQPFYPSTTRLDYSLLPRDLKLLDSDSSEVEVPPSRSGKLVSRLSKWF
jgi:hypothetical protein